MYDYVTRHILYTFILLSFDDTPDIHLSLHDALPISRAGFRARGRDRRDEPGRAPRPPPPGPAAAAAAMPAGAPRPCPAGHVRGRCGPSSGARSATTAAHGPERSEERRVGKASRGGRAEAS